MKYSRYYGHYITWYYNVNNFKNLIKKIYLHNMDVHYAYLTLES